MTIFYLRIPAVSYNYEMSFLNWRQLRENYFWQKSSALVDRSYVDFARKSEFSVIKQTLLGSE